MKYSKSTSRLYFSPKDLSQERGFLTRQPGKRFSRSPEGFLSCFYTYLWGREKGEGDPVALGPKRARLYVMDELDVIYPVALVTNVIVVDVLLLLPWLPSSTKEIFYIMYATFDCDLGLEKHVIRSNQYIVHQYGANRRTKNIVK